jgi:hypothetical protein
MDRKSTDIGKEITLSHELYMVTFVSDASVLLRPFLVYRANANGEFIVLRQIIRICMIVASYAYQTNPDSYSCM